MLTFAILAPAFGALVLAFLPPDAPRARAAAIATAALPLLALLFVWAQGPGDGPFRAVAEVPWIPAIGVAWRVGVDGMTLALSLMSAVLFLAAVAWPMEREDRPAQYYAWFLFLETASLGLFLTLDLLLFYIFFDLSLVGMFFLIGRWGHGERRAAALKFFVYTFAGSLSLLIGIIVLVLAMPVMTFDMRAIIAAQPLAGAGLTASLVLFTLLFGLAVKTPLFPVHTWLPPAHVDAPGAASAILAGVMLKMGTYGMIRIPLQMMGVQFADWAPALAILALVSILWGALVALGQTNLKRRIAYTSVNHMGYAVLGVSVAGSMVAGTEGARELALTGAVTEMIAHGLITGTLFLIAGSIWARAGTYHMDRLGGLAGNAPRMTVAATVAAFASLGLPGLAGFVAEVQIFIGAFRVYPWISAIGLLGILVTAALFLRLLQQVFFGERPAEREGFADFGKAETVVAGSLLGLVVLIGIWPAWLLTLIGGATGAIVAAVTALGGG